jgi:hypothetical protein
MGADFRIINFTGRKTGLIIPYWMNDPMRDRTGVPMSEKKGYCRPTLLGDWGDLKLENCSILASIRKNREFHKTYLYFHNGLSLLIEVPFFNSRGSALISLENIAAIWY